MNVLKTNPKGVDIPIQKLQTLLYTALVSTWNSSSWNSYGRAYRNQTEDGYIPEVYVGGTNKSTEYSEDFFDDSVLVNSFFFAGERADRKDVNITVPVSVIFMVKLDGLKPAITHRADEEVRADVERLLTTPRFGFTLTGWQTGIENVFREFAGLRRDRMKFRDMHPFHCFRMDLSLLYTPFNC